LQRSRKWSFLLHQAQEGRGCLTRGSRVTGVGVRAPRVPPNCQRWPRLP
jgi:hypothetical protein